MQSSGERAISGVTSGLIGLGDDVTWRARHFGVVWQLTSKITEYEWPDRFVDEMQRGPFASFCHEHRFEQQGQTTTMVDVVDYRLPLGLLGALADAVFVGRSLHRLIEERNRYVKATAEGMSR
jgi:ligand-binding SRPBCC domain-containing protein